MDRDTITDDLFDCLFQLVRKHGRTPDDVVASAGSDAPVHSLIRSLDAFQAGNLGAALDAGLSAHQVQPVLPNRYIGLLSHCAQQTQRLPELQPVFLAYAERAVAKGDWALALAVTKQLFSFCGTPEQNMDEVRMTHIAGYLDQIAQELTNEVPTLRTNPGKPKLAMVVVNLVDGGQAYAKRAMQFARYVDRSRYDCHLYSTEATWAGHPQAFAIGFDAGHTTQRAPECMSELSQLGIPITFCPALPFDESAVWLARRLEEDGIDAVVFQGGVNATIMWVASRLTRVPVKMTLCLGVNMYQPGQDATVYMNESTLEKEAHFWDPSWGRQVHLAGGADIQEARAAQPFDRADFGIPADAVTFGILSNYAEERLTQEYMDCVVEILRTCPNAVFVCMSRRECVQQKAYFTETGVAGQCRWPGGQTQAFRALKLLDFYFNEFPVGGSQVIRECLACGVPALAMRYSDKHAESAGATLIGEPYAVMERNPQAYTQRAIEWAQNPDIRQKAAHDLYGKARREFSAKTFIDNLCELMVTTLREKLD